MASRSTSMAPGAQASPAKLSCDPAQLVARVQDGDVAVLDALTRCYGERLAAAGRRYCRTASEADDAVQDALLAAGENLESFRGEGSLEGWLVRMVAHACSRMRRGRKNDEGLHARDVELSDAQGGAGAGDPERGAVRRELADVLDEALRQLGPTDRAIVLLAEAEGWTGPQIAAELGLEPGAVRTRLSRARARLRQSLVELNPDFAEPELV